jgi:two-component system cell cycle response regulator CtrA
MNIIAAGLDETTVAFLRANRMSVDQQEIDGPDELVDWFRDAAYDAGVIDIERSRLGIYAARPLRAARNTVPLVGISAGGDDGRRWGDHRAMFLENGGDDLLRAPVNPRELVASLLAATRRARGVILDVVVERDIGGGAAFRMNMTTGAVQVAGLDVHLTGKERAVLSMLASRPGRICSKEAVLTNIYGIGADHEPQIKIVDVFVCKLRRKLDELHPGASAQLIQTVWGQGYLFPREGPPAAAAA